VRNLAAARATSGGDYLVGACNGRTVRFADLADHLGSFERELDALGVPVGGVVALSHADPIEFSLAFLGSIAARRWVAPLDPAASDEIRQATLDRLRPHLLLTNGVATRLPDPAPVGGVAGADGGVLLETSGTTGTPKLIALGERLLIFRARAVVDQLGLTVAERCFNPLPLFHVNAEVVGLFAHLLGGATLVLDDRFHRTGLWELLASQRITWLNAVPAIIARCATLQPGESVPSSLSFVRSASAPLSIATLERFEAATGVPVIETYGMTEAASQITSNPRVGRRKPGSVGRPSAVELRIAMADPDTSGAGRVQIRGEGVIRSYAQAGYEERFTEGGWLETGDLGYLDEDGDLYLVGRSDDVINRGGEKVLPREIEEVIQRDPRVVAVVVLPESDPVFGAVPVAHLVVDVRSGDGVPAVLADLLRDISERCDAVLPKAKRPASYRVVEALPSGPTGKVRRSREAIGNLPTLSSFVPT
jgi:oxalate---CoA ligase